MKQDLEKLARGSGKVWHHSEVLIAVYEEVEGMSFAAGVTHLQGSLSQEALASLQHAALYVIEDTPPEVEAYGACYVTPHAPVQLNQGPRVPMAWVRHLSTALVPGEG